MTKSTKKPLVLTASALAGLSLALSPAVQAEDNQDIVTASPASQTNFSPDPSPSLASQDQPADTDQSASDPVVSTPVTEQTADTNTSDSEQFPVTPVTEDSPAPEVTEPTDSQTETKVLEKAETVYVVDETKDYGTEEVITEGQDSVETTTTTYKTVVNPRYDLPLDETYRYSPGTVYTIDETKELPSDRIVVDESKLFYSLPDDLNAYRELVTKIRENPSIREAAKGMFFSKTIDGITYDFPTEYWDGSGNTTTWEENSIINGITHFQATFLSTSDMIKSASLSYLSKIIPVDNSRVDDDWKRYYNSHIITDSQYADAKANFLRFKAITAQVEAELLERSKQALGSDDNPEKMEHYLEYYKDAKRKAFDAFDAITQRYNNTRGYPDVITDYNTKILGEEDLKWIEEQLKTLPPQILQNIPKLGITDNDLIPHRTSPVGVADPSTTIRLISKTSTEETPFTREKLLRTLLHEIGHTIDINSGLPPYINESVGSFSNNDDFTNLHNTYYKNRTVRPHYRDQKQEGFANGLGDYLAWKLFGQKPVRYIAQDGEINDVWEDHERYKEGYSPLDNQPLLDYFDNLYQKLLDQPTINPENKARIVDTVTTTIIPRKDGKIALGTKPQVVEQVLDFLTKEVENADLPQGQKQVVQAGKKGLKRLTTSYHLTDSKTGQLESSTVEEIVLEAIDEIIAIGTKVIQTVLPPEETKNEPTAPTTEKKQEETKPTVPTTEEKQEETKPTNPTTEEKLEETKPTNPATEEKLEETKPTNPTTEKKLEETKPTNPATEEKLEETKPTNPATEEKLEETKPTNPATEEKLEENKPTVPTTEEKQEEDKPTNPATEEKLEETKPTVPATEEKQEKVKPTVPVTEEKQEEDKPTNPATEEKLEENKPTVPTTEEKQEEDKPTNPATEEKQEKVKPTVPATEEKLEENKPTVPTTEEKQEEDKPTNPATEEKLEETKPTNPTTEEKLEENKPTVPTTEEKQEEDKPTNPATEEKQEETKPTNPTTEEKLEENKPTVPTTEEKQEEDKPTNPATEEKQEKVKPTVPTTEKKLEEDKPTNPATEEKQEKAKPTVPATEEKQEKAKPTNPATEEKQEKAKPTNPTTEEKQEKVKPTVPTTEEKQENVKLSSPTKATGQGNVQPTAPSKKEVTGHTKPTTLHQKPTQTGKHLAKTNPTDYQKLVNKINQVMAKTNTTIPNQPMVANKLDKSLPNTGSSEQSLLNVLGLTLLALIRLIYKRKID